MFYHDPPTPHHPQMCDFIYAQIGEILPLCLIYNWG